MTITKFNVRKEKLKNESITEILLSLLIFSIIIILLSNPAHYAETFIKGLVLFFSAVLPGLFPFMFLTKIMTSLGGIQKLSNKLGKITNKLFGTSGISAYVLLMSILSGYPIGAKIIGDLTSNQLISDSEAKKILTFSMTSGPVFVIGSVGTIMFGNAKVGIILFLSHIISNIINGILFCKVFLKKQAKLKSKSNITQYHKPEETQIQNKPKTNLDKILSESMYSSVISILIVGGFIAIFYCFSEILIGLHIFDILCFPLYKFFELIGINPQLSQGIMSGIIEVTRGAKELSTLYSSSPIISISLVSAIISFSGLSIIFQSKAFLSHTKIKTHFLIFSKSVHAILSFIVCLLLCPILL